MSDDQVHNQLLNRVDAEISVSSGPLVASIFTSINMRLTVYSAPWCRDCHIAKRWLAQNNIAFEEIDIEVTPGAAEEVIRQTGKRAIPQFVINGTWVQPYIPGKGFKYQEMAELLGVKE